jgi:mRNA interferase YafQ
MREMRRSTAFRRDYKRECTGRHGKQLDALLAEIVTRLAGDVTLPAANRDHALVGDWRGYRDCHLKPDLLLIHRKPDSTTLDLARLGSHSELFR